MAACKVQINLLANCYRFEKSLLQICIFLVEKHHTDFSNKTSWKIGL